MKRLLIGAGASLALSFGVAATEFGPAPAAYEAKAESYITERLADPRGAKFQFVGEPYMVFAEVAGHKDLPCWAVDVRVRSRLPTGGYGGYLPYTVLILDGQVVALRADARRIDRV